MTTVGAVTEEQKECTDLRGIDNGEKRKSIVSQDPQRSDAEQCVTSGNMCCTRSYDPPPKSNII